MYKGSNCDRKSQLSEMLSEPLNSRGVLCYIYIYFFISSEVRINEWKKENHYL